MMMKDAGRLAMAAGAASVWMVLAGCAAAPTLTPQARNHYDQTQQQVAQAGAALLVETCLYRLEVGTSHVYPALSEAGATRLAQAVSKTLTEKGVKVVSTHTPFVCSVLEPDYLQTLTQVDKPGGEQKPITTYPLKNTGTALPADQETTTLGLLKKLRALAPTRDVAADTEVKAMALDITPEEASALVRQFGAPYLWVVDIQEQDVSMGRSISMVALTSTLTLGLTGGAFASWSTNEDAVGNMVALIDLTRREVLWKKQSSAVARGLVDFERPVGTEEQARVGAAVLLQPFYPLPVAETTPATTPPPAATTAAK